MNRKTTKQVINNLNSATLPVLEGKIHANQEGKDPQSHKPIPLNQKRKIKKGREGEFSPINCLSSKQYQHESVRLKINNAAHLSLLWNICRKNVFS